MREEFVIPSRLDDPERWLFWTMDEAMTLFVPPIWGLFSGAFGHWHSDRGIGLLCAAETQIQRAIINRAPCGLLVFALQPAETEGDAGLGCALLAGLIWRGRLGFLVRARCVNREICWR